MRFLNIRGPFGILHGVAALDPGMSMIKYRLAISDTNRSSRDFVSLGWSLAASLGSVMWWIVPPRPFPARTNS